MYKSFQSSRKGKTNKGYNPHRERMYLERCNKICQKALRLLDFIEQKRLEIIERGDSRDRNDVKVLEQLTTAKHEISLFLEYLTLFSDQANRRILQGQKIPHQEKVFSIFKPFTRWIVKGKAGILQELGVPVAVVEDEHQFVLGHGVLWTGTDKDIAVALIKEIQEKFPEFNLTCSFDRSFYSPEVRDELDQLLETTAMPAKGHLNDEELARQNRPEYIEARKGHSGVESCMNNLNHRRMDVIREVKPEAFSRAVALSVIAANIHRLGNIVLEQQRKKQKQQRLRRAA